MPKFALERIDCIEGKQVFEKLLIDDQCQFDEFEKEISKNDKLYSELGKIYSYMEFVANGESLPATKFKDITPKKKKIKEYEFKSKNLRVYAIKKEKGKIIILGGFKNRQKRDIRKFRSIKQRYIEAQ
ncbi:MAG: hypothetical protein PVF73_03890 [Bacteroidales bacterium]|jgi:hypothetical protein